MPREITPARKVESEMKIVTSYETQSKEKIHDWKGDAGKRETNRKKNIKKKEKINTLTLRRKGIKR